MGPLNLRKYGMSDQKQPPPPPQAPSSPGQKTEDIPLERALQLKFLEVCAEHRVLSERLQELAQMLQPFFQGQVKLDPPIQVRVLLPDENTQAGAALRSAVEQVLEMGGKGDPKIQVARKMPPCPPEKRN